MNPVFNYLAPPDVSVSFDEVLIGPFVQRATTITNHTDQPQQVGLSVDLNDPEARSCGRRASQWGDPANPTVYSDAHGEAIIAVDDISRQHVNVFRGKMYDTRLIAPGATQKAIHWTAVEPLHYSELCRIMRSLYLAPTVPGPPAWLRLGAMPEDAELRSYVGYLGASAIIMPPTMVHGVTAHGPDLVNQPLDAIAKEMKRRKEVTGLPQLLYFDMGFLSPARQREVEQTNYNGQPVFDGTYYYCVPTADSEYGAEILSEAKMLLKVTGADGLYCDLSEGLPYPYTYNKWDGCTPYNAGSVTLLTESLRIQLLDEARMANMAPRTRLSAIAGVPRFAEYRRPEDLASVDLYTPLAYIAAPCVSELCAREAVSGVSPAYSTIEPWDVGFPRTQPSASLSRYPRNP